MKSSSQRQGRNQLRIIGGKWRGRKLDFPSVAGLRPTGDRIRETLFNWLAPEIEGAHCLDLFAGSGALGFECLSRGAATVLLLDRDAQVVSKLKEHCERLQADDAQVEQRDAMRWLAETQAPRFDVVFVDPPFQAELAASVALAVNDSNCLRPNALVYLELDRGQHFTAPATWSLLKQKTAGQVSFSLFRVKKP